MAEVQAGRMTFWKDVMGRCMGRAEVSRGGVVETWEVARLSAGQ